MYNSKLLLRYSFQISNERSINITDLMTEGVDYEVMLSNYAVASIWPVEGKEQQVNQLKNDSDK